MSKIAKKYVTVDTSEYRFSHRREPKGGRCWAFSEKRDPDCNEVKWFNGTYVEAKSLAVAEAAENGIYRIYVQP